MKCMKTEVYSWRVSADLKSGLEHEAHRRSISLASLLDLAARDWLKKGGAELEDDAEQVRLHQAVSECLGAFAGGDPKRNTERVRPMIAIENEADCGTRTVMSMGNNCEPPSEPGKRRP